MARRWTSGILAVGSLAVAAQAAVTVTAPSRGLQVIAGRTYTVEWEGTKLDSKVEIDLYHCGDNCDDPESCGDFVAELCGYHQNGGCKHIFGELDVTMPEPEKKVRDGMYKVRVTDSDDSWNSGCSGAFSLRSAEDTPEHGEPDGAYLEVISPMDDDGAVAGEEYTVEFLYDNGVGSRADRFKIDLYKAVGGGDCGLWVTSICDKPEIGCKDSTGDYDVEIPRGTPPGEYKIRVGRFEDDSLFSCSGHFSIVKDSSMLEDDEEAGGHRGDFYREGGYADDSDDDVDQSFSYGFYFEDDDLADDWWKNSGDSGNVDSRDTGDSDDSGNNKRGGRGDSSDDDSADNKRGGGRGKDSGDSSDDSKHDSRDTSEDDDGVSAGDEGNSHPTDGWFWGDDDSASRDDDSYYSYAHDDLSYSHSFDYDDEHIVFRGW